MSESGRRLLDAAEREARAALPDFSRLVSIGRFAVKVGETERAALIARELERVIPETWIVSHVVWIWERLGERAVLDRMRDRLVAAREPCARLAISYELVDACDEADRLLGMDRWYATLVAQAAIERGRAERAMSLLRPADAGISELCSAARGIVSLGGDAGAIELAQRAEQRAEARSDVNQQRAEDRTRVAGAYLSAKQFADALRVGRKALPAAQRPYPSDWVLDLASILIEAGDAMSGNELRDGYLRRLKIDHSLGGDIAYARGLARLGHLDDARHELRKARRARGLPGPLPSRHTREPSDIDLQHIARIHLQLDEVEPARELLERISDPERRLDATLAVVTYYYEHTPRS